MWERIECRYVHLGTPDACLGVRQPLQLIISQSLCIRQRGLFEANLLLKICYLQQPGRTERIRILEALGLLCSPDS